MNRCKRFMIQKALYPCLDKALTPETPRVCWRERENGTRSKGSGRPLSERYRIPPLRLPEALIFLRFRVFVFGGFAGFFRKATCRVAAGRQCIAWLLQKLDFRGFPYISGFFLGGNVLFTFLRLQSPIIRIHGSQRDISSVADHECSDGDEILLSST